MGDRSGTSKWRSWDNGGKLVLVSACFCLLSLFLPWLGDLMGESRRLTDMPVGSPLFLVVMYGGPLVYPVTTIWTGRVLRKGWGIVCAAFGFVLCLSLGAGLLGPLPELYRLLGGYYVYLLSMFGLAAGVLLHRRTSELPQPAERSVTPHDSEAQKGFEAPTKAQQPAASVAIAPRGTNMLQAIGGLLIFAFLGYVIIAAVWNILFTPLHIYDPWRLASDVVILGFWVYGLLYLLRMLFGRSRG